MRFNPDGSFDGCEVDEEARDGLEKYYNLLTWSIVSSSSKDNAYSGKLSLYDNEEERTIIADYLFINKDKLVIKYTDPDDGYPIEITLTRSTWPLWDDTGIPATSVQDVVRMFEGQWEASPELGYYALNAIRSNSQLSSIAELAEYIDQPIRIDMSNESNSVRALFHIGNVPNTSNSYPLIGSYAGKWVAINLGRPSLRADTWSDGYFILKNIINPDGYNVQYTRLGSKGVYIKPGFKDSQTDNTEGWYLLKKCAEPANYAELPISLNIDAEENDVNS